MTPTPSRLSSLVRLLLQLRALLTLLALALLLVGPEPLQPLILFSIVGFAGLSLLAAYFWERFAPYLRRHPVLVTGDIFCSTAILLIAGPTTTFFVATVITAAVAGVLFGGRGVALVSALLILGYAGSIAANYGPSVLTVQALGINPLLYPVAGFIGIRLRAVLTELAVEQSARQTAERAAAAAEERARLARDMHDSVAKTLRGTAMAAQALPMWVAKDPERALATARQVARAAETAAQEARQLIDGLRDTRTAVPLDAAVRDHVARWAARTGTAATVDEANRDIELDSAIRRELLAVLEEALANVERHAEAHTVTVSLHTRNQHAVLSVQDDGRGFDTDDSPTGHYGLVGMRERGERAGGTLDVVSTPGQGTTVRLRLPLPAATPASVAEVRNDDIPRAHT